LSDFNGLHLSLFLGHCVADDGQNGVNEWERRVGKKAKNYSYDL